LKRKAEKRVERQDKGIDEVEEGKQGNVIWKEMLGRMGVEKRSEREVDTEEEGMKEKRIDDLRLNAPDQKQLNR
jgi:hypothetical protein